MKKTLSLLLFVVLAWPSLVFGQGSEYDKSATLRGLEGIVVQSFLKGDVPESSVDSAELETAVELRLRQIGINVVDTLPFENSHLGAKACPVVVFIDAGSGNYAVFIEVVVVQWVQVLGNSQFAFTRTWESTGAAGLVNTGIRNSIKEQVLTLIDEFANDYLAANPPEPRSGQGGE